jgi:hypothetical protein
VLTKFARSAGHRVGCPCRADGGMGPTGHAQTSEPPAAVFDLVTVEHTPNDGRYAGISYATGLLFASWML